MIYDFFIYNLKVSMCLALLYSSYKLISRTSTHHLLNKGIILFALIFSFIIPLININYSTTDNNIAIPQIIVINSITSSDVLQSFSWKETMGLLFLIGVVISISHYLLSAITTAQIIRQSKHYALDRGATLCVTERDILPFNWFKYIVISRQDYNSINREVLIHEQAHLKLHHTFEYTFIRLMVAIQWYNPIMWLILRDIRAIHEYQADEAVINSGIDATKYQLLLIDRTTGGRCISCTNNFGQVKLKKRIIMMLKKPTTKWSYLKLIYIAPAIAIAMICFSSLSCTSATEKTAPVNKTEVVKATTHPLILLEGKEITKEAMNKIDPETIESINVIKGQDAIDKYGSKAKGGALEIKLK